ncbi:MAG: hypothetical protein RMM29_02015 [Planctomycetota bacterium]|nr:hypothetical protein [Planctomycetota bacterium]MCX8040292.1 hypothetical protein [Planctomycetota bacterium]MDW8372413.1 hypothetical protein [Planctomycetota bacterium]
MPRRWLVLLTVVLVLGALGALVVGGLGWRSAAQPPGPPPSTVATAAQPRPAPQGVAAPEAEVEPLGDGEALPEKLPPDHPMPPIDCRDLIELLRSYTHDELELLAALERSRRGTPPAAAQELIRLVRRGGSFAEAQQLVRERFPPEFALRAAAEDWLRKHYNQPLPPSPLFQGGGEPLVKPLTPVPRPAP